MKNILLRSPQSLFKNLSLDPRRSLLIFDYDGTLCPISPSPQTAQMTSEMKTAFGALCKNYPCVILSGRSKKDLRRVFSRFQVCALIGNHGLDLARDQYPKFRQLTREWKKQIRPWHTSGPDRIRGIEIEDKGLSLSIHYRKCTDPQQAHRKMAPILRKLPEIRLVEGKCVFNLVPRRAPNKGDAFLVLIKKFRAQHSLFVGDDVTDEDVFSLPHPKQRSGSSRLFVRVGRSKKSAAPFLVPTQRDVLTLIRLLNRMVTGMPLSSAR